MRSLSNSHGYIIIIENSAQRNFSVNAMYVFNNNDDFFGFKCI